MSERETDERFENQKVDSREGGVKLENVGDVKDPTGILEHMKPKIQDAGGDGGSGQGTQGSDSLAKQFEQLEYHGSSDQQLLELKSKMGLLGGPKETPKQLAGGQGSHVLSSLAAADALAVVPEDVDGLPAGAEVTLWWLDHG